MTLALYDRVQQTGTANTTVSFTLSGSVAGYQSFVAVGNGNTTYYGSFDTSGNWEVGLGTYSTTGPTLTRTTILSSSNGGLAVTFSGTVNVFITYPSEKSVNQDASNNVTLLAGLTVTNDASISGLTVGKGASSSAVATAVGNGALAANTSSGRNSAFGYLALTANTTGTYNTSLGDTALYTSTTGNYNTAVGMSALFSNTTASNNTAVGYQAGYLSTGPYNTYLGNGTGTNITSGQGNIYIGAYSIASAATVNYEMLISSGLGKAGKGGSTGFIDPAGGGVYQGNNSTLWSITSDQRLKKNIVDNFDGLNKIIAIQVRNFEYRSADEVTELEPQNAIDIKGVQLGAIAQELQAILPDCVKTESTGVMSVDASNITWYLINAVKELNAKLEAQALEIATLKGQ